MTGYPSFPPCCEGCQERRVGCHAQCARYLDAKKQHEERKRQIEREQQRVVDAVSLLRRGAERSKKRKHDRMERT